MYYLSKSRGLFENGDFMSRFGDGDRSGQTTQPSTNNPDMELSFFHCFKQTS